MVAFASQESYGMKLLTGFVFVSFTYLESEFERPLCLIGSARKGHVAESHEWLLTGDELSNR
jgi:hypothetical protein